MRFPTFMGLFFQSRASLGGGVAAVFLRYMDFFKLYVGFHMSPCQVVNSASELDSFSFTPNILTLQSVLIALVCRC